MSESTSRWHTYGPAYEGGALGKLLANIVQRSFDESAALLDVGMMPENAQESQDSVDWRELCDNEAKDAIAFFAKPETGHMLGVAVVVTEPLELLSNVLQHRDSTGFAVNEIFPSLAFWKSVPNICSCYFNPQTTRTTLTGQIGLPICYCIILVGATSWQILWWLPHATVRVASQVWSRLECLREVWDWKILTLGMDSPSANMLSDSDSTLLDELFALDGCCLGSWFTEVLHDNFSREDLESGDGGYREADTQLPSSVCGSTCFVFCGSPLPSPGSLPELSRNLQVRASI